MTLRKCYQIAEYHQNIKLDLKCFRVAKSLDNENYLLDPSYFSISGKSIKDKLNYPSDSPYAIENFFKLRHIPNLANKLNDLRFHKFNSIIKYEDQVLSDFKMSLVNTKENDYDLKKYIYELETLNNVRKIFHDQCRNMQFNLLQEYNNARLDLATLIVQIIQNE